MAPSGSDIDYRSSAPVSSGDVGGAVFLTEVMREELVRVLEAYRARATSDGGEVRKLDDRPHERFMEYWQRFTDSSRGNPLRDGEFKHMTRLGFVAFISLMSDGRYYDAWRLSVDCLPNLPNSDGTQRRPCDAMKVRQEDALIALWSDESAKSASVSDRDLLSMLSKLPVVKWIMAVDDGEWKRAVGIAIKHRVSQRRLRVSVEGFHHYLVSTGRGDEARGLEHQYPQFFSGRRRR
jgi:hypothetical protein